MNFRQLSRTWIVAEIGVNHEGNFDIAADLVHKAAECGVDAVKFQTFTPEHYISSVQPERLQRAKTFVLSAQQFRHLADLAGKLGLVFFSTPFHAADADFLDAIVPVFKISSGDLTYLDLIRHVARKNKPMIISTGLGVRQEIEDAVAAVLDIRPAAQTDGSLVLMHCIAAYPTPAAEANLRNIQWLKDTFNVPVGYSDHTLGVKACELAVAAGATVIEKHFTYRKEDQTFHDHHLSANPADMKALVAAIREAENYLGQTERQRGVSEGKLLAHMRRSVGAIVDIPEGEAVRREWLTYLRPAWGLDAAQFDWVIGKKLRRSVPAGDLIRLEDVIH